MKKQSNIKIATLITMLGAMFMMANPTFADDTAEGHTVIPQTDGVPDFVIDRIDLTNNQLEFHVDDYHLNGRKLSEIYIGFDYTMPVVKTPESSYMSLRHANYNWTRRMYVSENKDKIEGDITESDGNRTTWIVDSESDMNTNAYNDFYVAIKLDDGSYWNTILSYATCKTDWIQGDECYAESYDASKNVNNVIYKYRIAPAKYVKTDDSKDDDSGEVVEPGNKTDETEPENKDKTDDKNQTETKVEQQNKSGTDSDTILAGVKPVDVEDSNSVSKTNSTEKLNDEDKNESVIEQTNNESTNDVDSSEENIPEDIDNSENSNSSDDIKDLDNVNSSDSTNDSEDINDLGNTDNSDDTSGNGEPLEVPVLGGTSDDSGKIVGMATMLIVSIGIGAILIWFFFSVYRKKHDQKQASQSDKK